MSKAKQALEIIIVAALMIFVAGMDFWNYLITGIF